jgi:hypothetical protein
MTSLFKKLLNITLLAVLAFGVLSYLDSGVVRAYSRTLTDSITMNNSTSSASGVDYQVSFDAATTATLQGIVIDFCSNSPVIGDVCDTPAGFSVGTPAVSYTSGITSSWSATSADADRTVILTYATGTAITAGQNISFDITTITNPSTANSTFYARILTYTSSTEASGYSVTSSSSNINTPTDAGGVALSTGNNISVSFIIPETLSFCVYTSSSCGTGGSSIVLGDNHGILSSSGPFVDKTAKYDIATNAVHGAAITLHGATLTAGSNSIAALSTPTASVPGTSQFGICTYTTSGSSLVPFGDYDGNAGSGGTACQNVAQSSGNSAPGSGGGVLWYFNQANTTSTYGDEIASMTPDTTNTGVIALMANISTSQQAGIYSTSLILVATGTY